MHRRHGLAEGLVEPHIGADGAGFCRCRSTSLTCNNALYFFSWHSEHTHSYHTYTHAEYARRIDKMGAPYESFLLMRWRRPEREEELERAADTRNLIYSSPGILSTARRFLRIGYSRGRTDAWCKLFIGWAGVQLCKTFLSGNAFFFRSWSLKFWAGLQWNWKSLVWLKNYGWERRCKLLLDKDFFYLLLKLWKILQ